MIDPIRAPGPSIGSVEASTAQPHPDAARVRAALADDAALEALLAALLPRVRNLVRYLVRSDALVDDVAQDGLIAIARGLPTYRGDAGLESWADRVVARCTFAAVARRRREPEPADEGAVARIVAPDEGPEALAVRRSAVRVLDRLPDPQRQALVLHHVVGMSVSEIARDVGVPAETVRSRLRLGAARFRALSANEGGDAP